MKIKHIFLAGLTLSLSLLGGCGTSSGNAQIAKLNDCDIESRLVRGKTTSNEVRLCLGEPTDVDFDTQNRKKWSYTHTKKTATGISYVPYVNLLKSGTNDLTKKLVIVFDAKDRVLDYQTTESKTQTNTGLMR